MRRQKSFARTTVNIVGADVVLSMSPPRAHQIAKVLDGARPREDWLRRTILSMLTAADELGFHSPEIQRRVDWLDASAVVDQQLLHPSGSVMVLVQEIADHVLRLSDARSLTIAVASPDDPALLEVRVAAGTGASALLGRTVPRTGSLAGSAMDADRGQIASTADLHARPEPTGSSALSWPVMAVPIHSGGRSRGAIVVHRRPDQPSFDITDLSMAEDFARQTSLALELAEERTVHDRQQRRREHDTVAESLHGSLLQRLFSIGMTIQSAEAELRRSEDTPEVRRARAHLSRAVDDLNDAIREGRASLQSAEEQLTTGVWVTEGSQPEQEVAASIVHEAAVHAAELTQEAVETAADRAAAAASTARTERSAAVDRAAEVVAEQVTTAAAVVKGEADAAAVAVAQAAFDAALVIASTVAPGTERDAALTATLVATAVSAVAIKTAAVTAAARADVAREAAAAASAAAVAAADAAKMVDLEVLAAAEAVRAVATETAVTLAERTDAEALAFALSH